MRPGLTAGALGPSIVSLNTNKSCSTSSSSSSLNASSSSYNVRVFITALPITKLFAGGRGILEDMCYEGRRAEACVN
jgi:hypothetical protein